MPIKPANNSAPPMPPSGTSDVLAKLWKYGGKPVLAGAAGGATVAGLCTPWDRTINVASEQGIPLRDAFKKVRHDGLYRGLGQTLGQRTIQGVTSMPLYDLGKWGLDRLTGAKDSQTNAFLSGILMGGITGAGYGVISTPKYQTWRTHEALVPTLRRMVREGGLGAFTKGIYSTAARDMVFGGVFYPIKTYGMAWAKQPTADGAERSSLDRQWRETLVATIAVTSGVLTSSPLNYTRTRAFNTAPGETDPGLVRRLGDLARKAKASNHPVKVLRQHLVVGGGATRAVIGMILQSRIYDALVRLGDTNPAR